MVCPSGLELHNLNVKMGMKGIPVGSELRFYSYNLLYAVTFGDPGAFGIEKFNKFLGYWESVQFSGTFQETANTLNKFQPFLDVAQINQYWAGVPIPPENPNGGVLLDPV